MALGKSFKFYDPQSGYEYTLEIDISAIESVLHKRATVSVTARRSDGAYLEIYIRYDHVENRIEIYNDEIELSIQLDSEFESQIFDAENTILNALRNADPDLNILLQNENVENAVDTVRVCIEDRIGEIAEAIPAPDPVIGCFIKAGLTTTIAQIVICRRSEDYLAYWQNPNLTWRQHISIIAKCLKRNGMSMMTRAGARFFRCAISGGLA